VGTKHPVVAHILNSYDMVTMNAESDALESRITHKKDEITEIIERQIDRIPGDDLELQKRQAKIIDMIDDGISKLTVQKQVEFLDNLADMNKTDWFLLNKLSMIENLAFDEVLRGAHIRIEDSGVLYQAFSSSSAVPSKDRA